MLEEDALSKEKEIIEYYRNINQCFCNFEDGGKSKDALSYDKNGMYNKKHSKESRRKISETMSDGRLKGKNNSQYGVSPKERMSEEVYESWKNNHAKSITGENNPNYGNKKLSEFYKDNPDIAKEKQSRRGIQNGMCKPIKVFDLDMNLLYEFKYISECIEYLTKHGILNCKIESAYGRIYDSNKHNKPYKKLYFKY